VSCHINDGIHTKFREFLKIHFLQPEAGFLWGTSGFAGVRIEQRDTTTNGLRDFAIVRFHFREAIFKNSLKIGKKIPGEAKIIFFHFPELIYVQITPFWSFIEAYKRYPRGIFHWHQ
jgi:hypothetical protein